MIRQKRIHREALRCFPNDSKCCDAFCYGAAFADKNPDTSSLWHDKKEEPNNDNVEILTVSKTGCTDICVRYKGVYNYIHDWKGIVKEWNIDQWAYISDLLPKGSKK